MNNEYHIIVYCPECKKRVFDKVSPANGLIEIKCPHCHKLVTINLAFRLNYNPLKYRISHYA